MYDGVTPDVVKSEVTKSPPNLSLEPSFFLANSVWTSV